jgi:hypothetical protein
MRAIRALREVFSNTTFRITNQVRIDAFETLEGPAIAACLGTYQNTQNKQFRRLLREADRLDETLWHNISIAEEGNSKAILIFTLVTIVFLPLSFVSSLFGMNTADIRDMGSTQTLFWAVALPVTAAVGGLSLLAAYGGPKLRQGVQSLKDRKADLHLLPPKRARSDDEEQTWSAHSAAAPVAPTGAGGGKRSVFEITKRQVILKRRERTRSRTRSRSRSRSGTFMVKNRNVALDDMFFR